MWAMSALASASVTFVCFFGCAMGAMSLRFIVPAQHLKDDSKDALKAGLAIIGTMGGLVLGLLVASATGSYNAQRGYVIQLTSELALLDRALGQYGPAALPARAMLRGTAQQVLVAVWPERSGDAHKLPSETQGDAFFDRLEDLTPGSPLQTSVKGIAVGLAMDIAKTRYLIYEQRETGIPKPLLLILIFWFCVTFAGIGIFAPRNLTTTGAIALCALAIAGTIYLILSMYQPFSGLMEIPSAPLENVISTIGR
jgi:hypothetical protein